MTHSSKKSVKWESPEEEEEDEDADEENKKKKKKKKRMKHDKNGNALNEKW